MFPALNILDFIKEKDPVFPEKFDKCLIKKIKVPCAETYQALILKIKVVDLFIPKKIIFIPTYTPI